ncbi:hypothetical protein KC19_2G099500 [Ceratodon purpureus]|uniref:AAA+ ATPase domain-containing protein n=1 Tax=Ceratodon purpureus TaxID=3225 RepID=A0A8T0IW17_CERPU|nr:hypothetical protein KC19_2G099500 [Ceratodon purpureus]
MNAVGASVLWSTFWAGGSVLGALSFLLRFLPDQYGSMFSAWVRKCMQYFNSYILFEIPEFYGAGKNEIYDYVESYLSSNTAIAAEHISLCRAKNATHNTFSLGNHETLEDSSFMSTKVWWTHEIHQRMQPGIQWGSEPNDEKRKYFLKIRKADKTRMLEPYVQHVIDTAKLVKERTRDRNLYTNVKDSSFSFRMKAWESVPFKHPSTFETLAMDPDMKDDIKEDLLEFTKGREFYEKAGKPWKRGYLLYGPPGTGKSSMIAAIANFLKYDIYDVELTEVSSNSDLRKLLIQTSDRSVIVIEDIDCSVELAERAKAKKVENKDSPEATQNKTDEKSKVTLSGLLNFTDRLWSCCGSERIIIFTTNYIEKLDPALLRAGRMDKHILMSWCKFSAFRTLARNNLGLEWHDLFPQIEEAMEDKAITPADVSEFLLKKKRNPTAALEGLLEALAKAPSVSEKPPVKTLDFDEINLLAGTIVDANTPPAAEDTDSASETSSSKVEQDTGKDVTSCDVNEPKIESSPAAEDADSEVQPVEQDTNKDITSSSDANESPANAHGSNVSVT